jgi:gamma-glutamylcyclotransferase (GGCT)/AIG2-like uncharacterized protein YtfP
VSGREFLLFVCSATMQGEEHHQLLAQATLLGRVKTPPEYDLVDLGQSGSLVAGGRTEVTGELYTVDAATLAALDVHEGHPVLHTRTTITLADGREAQAYLLHFEQVRGRRRIRSGDWHQRRTVVRTTDGGPLVRWARTRFR